MKFLLLNLRQKGSFGGVRCRFIELNVFLAPQLGTGSVLASDIIVSWLLQVGRRSVRFSSIGLSA
jgi:hypothetical protein